MTTQFEQFVKQKLGDLCKNISRMTYAYINPETEKPTVVPPKHYESILKTPIEEYVTESVNREMLSIIFKQLQAIRKEHPKMFVQSLILMDINKEPQKLEINEEIALCQIGLDLELRIETEKKKFQILDKEVLQKYEEMKSDEEFMSVILSPNETDNEDYNEWEKVMKDEKSKEFLA